MSIMFAEMVSEQRNGMHCSSTGSLSPPSSESPGLQHSNHSNQSNMEEHRTLQLALELSMLDLSDLHGGHSPQELMHMNNMNNLNSMNGHHMNGSLISPTQNGLVPGSTLNAFTSMLVAAGNCMPNGDDRSKKSQNMTECVPVPSSEHVAEIVGRQGCKIKALRAKTNTYIKTPVRGEEPVFVVTGRKEDVAKAKREILSAAEHFSLIRASRKPSILGGLTGKGTPPGPPTNVPGQITIQVRVPYRVVGLVVGPKGATIKHIQQQTHTYIVTPSRDKEPVFEVTGMPDNVQSARRQIEAHIALRTGNQAQQMAGGALNGLLNDDNISPSQEFLSSLYKNGLGSLLNLNCYLDTNDTCVNGTPPSMEHGFQQQQQQQITSSTGSSTCSSSSSSSSKSASMMHRTDLVDIWKTLGADTSIDCDEGIGESPINIWSLQNSSSVLGSRSSPSASASPTDSLLTGLGQALQKRECLLCGDKEVTHALVPCGHNMFCQECSSRLCNTGESCPICSQQVMQAMRILV